MGRLPGTAANEQPVRLRLLAPMALQHLIVMITGPISSAFLLTQGLHLGATASAHLLSALLLLCGIGTAIQSVGPWRWGARMPFVMLPGGASVVLFVQISESAGPAAASGAVLVTALAMLVAAPLCGRLVKLFPPVVLGTMIMVIGLNLIKITAGLLSDTPHGPSLGTLELAAVTVSVVVLGYRLLPGAWRRFSVLLGIVSGSLLAAAAGRVGPLPGGVLTGGPVLAWPALLPFGAPQFDLLATVPLVLFGIGAMAEASAQTMLNTEAIGAPFDPRRDVAATVRGDAITSILAGLLGGPLMVTSGENIGLVRLSGVRSRFVTLGTAALLVALAVVAPLARLINAVPAAVVGGAGLIVFAMITAMGARIVAADRRHHDVTVMTATLGLTAGALPILAPSLYQQLPPRLALILNSGVTMAAVAGILGNQLFASIDRAPARRGIRTRTGRPADESDDVGPDNVQR